MDKKKTIKKFAELYHRDSVNGPNRRMPEHLRYHWYGNGSRFFDYTLEKFGHEETFNDFCDMFTDLENGKYTTIELMSQPRFDAMYEFSKRMIRHYYISKLYSAVWYRVIKLRYKFGIKWNRFLNRLYEILFQGL